MITITVKKFGPGWTAYGPSGEQIVQGFDKSYVERTIKNKYLIYEDDEIGWWGYDDSGNPIKESDLNIVWEEETQQEQEPEQEEPEEEQKEETTEESTEEKPQESAEEQSQPETKSQEQNNSSSSGGGGFGNNAGKDPLGRWEEMPDHHGKQFMEGKQTSAITPEGYPDDETGGFPFIFKVTHKETNHSEQYPCMDEAEANQKKSLFEQRFNDQKAKRWPNGKSLDETYTLEIIQKSPIINNDYSGGGGDSGGSQGNSQSNQNQNQEQSPEERLAAKEAEVAAKVAKDNTKTLGECIASKEDINMEDAAAELLQKSSEMMAKSSMAAISAMSGAAGSISGYSNQLTQQGTDQVNKVAAEGSDYCKKQNDANQAAAAERVSGATAAANAQINNAIDSMAQASGAQKGLEMANKVNQALEEQAAKLVNDKKKMEAAAATKAEAALAAAKLAIMAMTGISL